MLLSAAACKKGGNPEQDDQQKATARITFIDDDGYAEAMANWEQIYERTGITPTCALITGRVGQSDRIVSWEEVDRLKSLGFEFVSHSHNHIQLAEADEATIRSDLQESVRCMEEHGLNAKVLVYPYISHNETSDAIVKDYFDYGITSNNALNKKIEDPYDIKRYTFINQDETVPIEVNGETYRVHPPKTKEEMHSLIDQAIEEEAWLIFMCHFRNSYSDGYYFDEAMMDSVLDTIEYAESKGVVIDTFSSILPLFTP